MNYLVETKTEYTIQLVNILAPIIHDGISSIYDDAMKVAVKDEELKVFQSFLRRIPQWNNTLLEEETQRVLTASNCPELLRDLVNAIIKANIMVLTNTPPQEKHNLKISYQIELPKFIHNCYIETARNVYNNPFMYYHDYTLYEQKRNQRDALDLIKTSIKEAIRKMLPLRMILDEYLGNSFKDANEEFDKTLTEEQRNKLNGLLLADGSKPPVYTLAKSDAAPPAVGSKTSEKPPRHGISEKPQRPVLVEKTGKPDNEEADSVSYYRRPTIEDTFSNHNSVKRVVVNKDNQPVRDSYTLDMSNGGTDIESIRKKLGERFRKKTPEIYKI
jgi:hypothetical protein